MSYAVHFRGRDVPSITVDNERGAKILDLWFDTNKKNTPIDIDGNGYLVGDIKSVLKVADPIRVELDKPELPSGKQCRGQYSIQHEINNIIKSDYPDWAQKIQSTTFREKIRKQLRAMEGVLWCDYRTGECYCD